MSLMHHHTLQLNNAEVLYKLILYPRILNLDYDDMLLHQLFHLSHYNYNTYMSHMHACIQKGFMVTGFYMCCMGKKYAFATPNVLRKIAIASFFFVSVF